VTGHRLESPETKSELALLRQFLRAALNDPLAGNEVALALSERLDASDLTDVDALVCSRTFLKRALLEWQQFQSGQNRAQLFGRDAILDLQDLTAEKGHHAGVLIDVFGFSVAETADCLGASVEEIEALHQQEREWRKDALTGIALVIEDDPIIASGIAAIAVDQGLQLAAISDGVDDAVAAANQMSPSVIISDYDLGPGGSGTDAVKAILREHDCSAIFVTAYPDQVLTGDDFEPTFVLQKPYKRESLKAALHYAVKLPGLSAIDAEVQDEK
jgi:CheY-like chemotaxis protein